MKRLCALYGVTRAGSYAWPRRGESTRQVQDRVFLEAMRAVFEQSRGTSGSPRIHQAFVARGHRLSRRRVERLMRTAGLRARIARLSRANPKLHAFFRLPNRLRRAAVSRPNQVWVGDITDVRVAGRWRSLAVVMDRCSRRRLGWSLGRRRDVRLTRAALLHAVHQRQPPPGVIFHSDRGSEYAGLTVRRGLRSLSLAQRMNDRALGDNAHRDRSSTR